MILRSLFIAYAALVGGCATFVEHHKFKPFPATRHVTVELRELHNAPLNVLGKAELYADGKCIIYLRKYPQCLSHELRHCFEGNWHEGRGTDSHCYGE